MVPVLVLDKLVLVKGFPWGGYGSGVCDITEAKSLLWDTAHRRAWVKVSCWVSGVRESVCEREIV